MPEKRPRGRPPKVNPFSKQTEEKIDEDQQVTEKPKRGRPRKNKDMSTEKPLSRKRQANNSEDDAAMPTKKSTRLCL